MPDFGRRPKTHSHETITRLRKYRVELHLCRYPRHGHFNVPFSRDPDGDAWRGLFRAKCPHLSVVLDHLGVSANFMCLSFNRAYVNQRRRRPFPDGWLWIVVYSAVFKQLLVTVFGVWLTMPYSLHRVFSDALLFPHAFVAGMIVGVMYGAALLVIPRSFKRSG